MSLKKDLYFKFGRVLSLQSSKRAKVRKYC